ncbi:unnamed protein product (macronuclear) [Paramecium tetraurelia]|uniref:Uncharacterized protein n=1 Tax=Paramecium tetraurelia TaxID=5888 RepID=A0C0X2_PARTE|nr:uncharacterized protein GSPATT00033915001 [Paramecium tetraurelia]CAK64439.1 unnamed protein product [Paramecium tetraurelia]|eukprot:XP_001431837.1 hypothetical protein (macronuclear) [Paramecium tetraurelia strain d4-2]
MKQVVATNEYSILRKVQMLHSHAQPKDSNFTLGRTTSYESSQFCRSLDIMVYRRASTKDEINYHSQSKNPSYRDDKLVIGNIAWINPTLYIEMDELQTKVWRSLKRQQLESVYSVDIIVLKNQSEFEFSFDISMLSCFLRVRELSVLINENYANRSNRAKLQVPYLSILIGRVKTQKLDGNMRLFELAHILLNGQRTLILQESCLQF